MGYEFKEDYQDQIDIRSLNNYLFDIKQAAMNTVDKQHKRGDEDMKPEVFRKYLISEHSPIRSGILRITFKNIYYPTSVHFCRHVHSIPYVTTSRDDRTYKPRSLDNPVTHMMDINLQGLIDMMQKRLCIGCCAPDTYNWAKSLKLKMMNHNDPCFNIIGESLVPSCVYKSGCPEFKNCGFFRELVNKHREELFFKDFIDIFTNIKSRCDLYNEHLADAYYKKDDK